MRRGMSCSQLINKPPNKARLALLVCELEAASIPYFVAGQYFGSLYPGPQVASYNERAIKVPENYIEHALEIVADFRSGYEPTATNLAPKSKLRVVVEFLFMGWSVPGGKRPSNKRL
jgi:hypothetical protein